MVRFHGRDRLTDTQQQWGAKEGFKPGGGGGGGGGVFEVYMTGDPTYFFGSSDLSRIFFRS